MNTASPSCALSKAWMFAGPALAVLGLVLFFPGLWVIWLSLHRSMPVFGIHRFAGLANFAALAGDPQFVVALINTLGFVAASMTVELGLALAMALALWGAKGGNGWIRVAILVPWALPTVVSARMWEWIYQPDYGVLNHLLSLTIGLAPRWLGDPLLAMPAAVLTDIWKTTPFLALILMAGLATIPAELYEAARMDGAGRWQTFRYVTLPLLRPALLVALLFRSIEAFRVFDSIWVLTGGGPAGSSETLSIYAYRLLFSSMDFGMGSAAAVVTFVLVLAVSVLYVRVLEQGD